METIYNNVWHLHQEFYLVLDCFCFQNKGKQKQKVVDEKRKKKEKWEIKINRKKQFLSKTKKIRIYSNLKKNHLH